ncbi:MAG TPA: aconitate hydratase AcnA [Vicinamibacterales bacterium]
MRRKNSTRTVDLASVARGELDHYPVTLRILLENVARTQSGADRDASIDALRAWLETGTSEAEIPVQPCRVLMHDTTSTPALVDIAALRDAVAEAGGDPGVLVPRLPVDVSVDHSLAVEVHARRDAVGVNQAHEMRRNAERYRFLRWAAGALPGVRIHPPGTGIMHTINVEQLATLVRTEIRDGETWTFPELMIGTDSHTPMVSGLGVLAWGVGGLEAEAVMFGMPVVMRIPDVVGVRLTGRLRTGALSTDLALVVTQRLREIGVAGEVVEFHGPGVSTLSAADRCVVANMAPEYGATTGYFPIDERTLQYLRDTGREAELVAQVEEYARGHGLWFDPDAEPRFTRTLAIDLDQVGMHVAGPRRPQDLHPYWGTGAALRKVSGNGHDTFPIAIAAITSCTNTTDPRLLIAAGLVARKARAAGLRVDPGIKTSLAPGSPAAARYLARSGLDEDLAALGFDIVGFGCTTCIGNSGPLPAAKGGKRVAVLSGNRNFPGRIHPELDLAFIMSPPLVIAFALAGEANRNLRDEGFTSPEGKSVSLKDIWPSAEEIDAALLGAIDRDDFGAAFREAGAAPAWHGLSHPSGARFPWNPASTILRRPPFASQDMASTLGRYVAHPLLVVGDDVTTDHISPASAIPSESLVADYLVERGEDRADLNVFASRRGNWEVMLRAAFHNPSLVNLLAPGAPVAHTIHAPSGEIVPLWIAAERYRAAGESVVLVAGHRFGTGSSRDWAAKAQCLLGIRAVLASSFERIHRANLVSMGILPVKLPAQVGPRELALQPGDRLEVDAAPGSIRPRCPVEITVLRRDGRREIVMGAAAVETRFEAELLREGGILPHILRSATR